MDELAVALAMDGLQVHPRPARKVTPPAAVVNLPEGITFDEAYVRGLDRMTLVVALLVGRANNEASVTKLAGYADGSGATSIKAALESHTYTTCGEVIVTSVDFDVISMASVEYLAAVFAVDISGKGA